MWTGGAEPIDSPDANALLRDYFAELSVRYFHRETTEPEIDETLDEFPSTGLALFLVLRADRAPAGCLGVYSTGELTRTYFAPQFRRGDGARALLTAAESWARARGLARLFLDTRTFRGLRPETPGSALPLSGPKAGSYNDAAGFA